MGDELTTGQGTAVERGGGGRALRLSFLVVKIAALGAVAGAVAGVLALGAWAVVFGTGGIFFGVAEAVALLGAGLGAVLFPLAGFTLLREVPLWKVLVTTIVGTAIGGLLSVPMVDAYFLLPPIAGFVLSVASLVFGVRRSRRRGMGAG